MRTRNSMISELRRELGFLDGGGYRVQTSWRLPLFFEDSPICSRKGGATCPDNCALLAFVPTKYRNEVAPCRHIPLNEAGETLHTMYRTATLPEIEAAVRGWLLKSIAKVELLALDEVRAKDKEAA